MAISTAESPPRGDGDRASARVHLHSLDLVRNLAVALVIGVHTLSFGAAAVTVPVGAFITVLHTSREVFFVLTAFALTYSYGRRRVTWWSFWRRRYGLVVPAYVAWSVIYFLVDDRGNKGLSASLATLGRDLLSGEARYHLYFLLVSMQMYLAFPLLRWVLSKTEGHHVALGAVAAAYQFAVTAAIHYGHLSAGPLAYWFRHPDALLSSYVLYYVAGGLGAWHLDRLVELSRRYLVVVAGTLVVAVSGGVGVYLAEVHFAGQSPLAASAVFQPVVVVESLAISWAFFAVGVAWSGRGTPGRVVIAAGADASFGIFLSHPIVLQGVLALGRLSGCLTQIRRLPAAAELAVLLGGVVPFVYVSCGLLTAVERRTPLSLILTGRASIGRAGRVAGPAARSKLRRPALDAPVPPALAPSPEVAVAAAPVADR